MAALFSPFRALGYITESTPFAVQRRGKETFVVVSVGKAWQVGLAGRRLSCLAAKP
jgi:U3 small nucleolar RNA-associated protein 21